jgi:hypothetical protein
MFVKYAALVARLLLIFPIYQLPKKGSTNGIDLYSDLEVLQTDCLDNI